MATDSDTLNEDQVRLLRITCEHIDRLLSDIEGILNESASLAAFPSYTADIAPVQQKTIEDYIARIRAGSSRSSMARAFPGNHHGFQRPGLLTADSVLST